MTDDETRVEWRKWGPEAFEEARADEKPVLLSLTATWCDGCHEMDVETYGEPRIAANVNDDFVPVRVDVDRHPRVRERYNMGGFPSTVFCTPSGELITGAMYLGPDGMRQVLDRVRETWSEKGDSSGRVPRALADDPTPEGPVESHIEEHLAGQLDEKYDDRFAGWGDGTKFPMPRTIEFALKRSRRQAVETLRTIAETLFDDVEGGFFRYADGRDWSDPHHEKLLDSNAALVRAFANGYLYTGDDDLLNPAMETRDFLADRLWNGAAFGGSVGPGDENYYGQTAEGRAESAGPRRDLTAYAGANALAADALLTLTAYTDDDTARDYAVRTLDFLDTRLIDDGVVTHFAAGETTGETHLLEDHARTVSAFVRGRQVLGDDWYLDRARAVADVAIDELKADGGAFRDGLASGSGLLDRPLRPLDANVEMANALCDLAAATGEEPYEDAAQEAIGAFAGAWDRIGVQVAGYGSVAARVTRPTLVVAVGATAGSDLHRAALRVADHEKVVVPDADGVSASEAVVSLGDRERMVTTPEQLMTAVSDITDGV
ncbi:thioredoxin domain-containing protein [Halogeometricum borinquense]|uniref:Thioredoxin domain-containing protein n=1 Tax=Halogeometricum borinquense TaxID=60847 RepID=A0A6C0UM74_9EURY|nr:DUF255 domain-containing protein [Halogeometricum borinquense]QIB75461.1 thioredoxin domain-containing protein [Halogeometricum borinquense]QIQ75728.1 thioredoxin domain-containing protein [Halogeometricum borinquense]